MLDDVVRDAETNQYKAEQNNMAMMATAMTHVAQTTRDAQLNSSVSDLLESIMKETVEKTLW